MASRGSFAEDKTVDEKEISESNILINIINYIVKHLFT
jgi:hypothetical protein